MRKAKLKKIKTAYLGSNVNPENRREFINKQIELFKQKYERTKKEDDEITDNQLQKEAEHYARYVVNKEKKHFEAYLRGEKSFKYKKRVFPVMTEEFIKNSSDVKEIINIKDDGNRKSTVIN